MVPDATPTSDGPLTHEIGRRTYVVADVDPLDVDGVRTVAVGTGVWLLAFVGLLPFYGRLRADGHLWWLWTCLAGFGLGLAGWDYCRRRRRQRLEREADEVSPDEPPPGRIAVPADPPLAPEPRTPPTPRSPAQKPPFMPRPGDRDRR